MMIHDQTIIAAYYTPGAYEAEAERLAKSLDKLSLHYRLSKLADQGDWISNTHLRPRFLAGIRHNWPTMNILSLDADAVLHSDPLEFFAGLQRYDIACHKLKDELLPGTLWLSPTETTDEMLQQWREWNEKYPARPDRYNFNAAVESVQELVVFDLPAEYCWIFDMSEQIHGRREPVIEHLQASRSFRKPKRPKDKTRNERIRQIEEMYPMLAEAMA